VCCLIVALWASSNAPAQSALDNTFNTTLNGWVSTIAVQADGKILVGGSFTTVNGVSKNNLARLNPNGSLDSSFTPSAQFVSRIVVRDGKIYVAAGDGLRRFDVSGTLDWLYPMSVATFDVDSQQRVIFGGQFTRIENQYHRNLARLGANGILDAAFAPSVGCCVGEGVNAILAQGDAMVVGGFFQSINGSPVLHFGRINNDGSNDVGFHGSADSQVLSLAATADGKIFRASQQTLARHLGDGSLDPAFNDVSAGGSSDDRFVTVAVQTDGRPVVGGNFSFDGGVTRKHVARLNSDGAVDSSFAIEPNDTVQAIAIQTDGSILIGGNFTAVNGSPRTALARITPAAPVLHIAAAVSGNIILSWPAVPNASLESCPLNGTTWSSMSEVPVNVNGRTYVTNSATAPGRLYRLRMR
jgi:uncharacterized delta-60 repeat protein